MCGWYSIGAQPVIVILTVRIYRLEAFSIMSYIISRVLYMFVNDVDPIVELTSIANEPRMQDLCDRTMIIVGTAPISLVKTRQMP